jgi:hypothetical protein
MVAVEPLVNGSSEFTSEVAQLGCFLTEVEPARS